MKRPLAILIASLPLAATAAEAPPTWEKHVRPILKARCFKCHSDDEQKADLNLQTLAATLKGGGSGDVLKKGRPNSSLLMQSIEHADGVEKMPPKSAKMPEEEIELIRQWILAGLPERSGEAASATNTFVFHPAAQGVRPENPAMPADLPKESPSEARLNPVTALAASPWAPLVATGGHGTIRFFHTQTRESLGTVPFPEGAPQVLRFSRDGALLLAAGGKPVQSGKAALYDVTTGKRLAVFGDETDTVLAADFSPDGKRLALGGPGKTVKVFHTETGALAYKIAKHTDWITALEFSPEGNRLATADRAGGIHVWESADGGIFLSLSEHKESVSSIAWRPDGKVLASASEDGSVILWNTGDGFPVKTLKDIHTPKPVGKHYGKLRGGVLSLAWTAEGQLLTAGRDQTARAWDSTGGRIGACDPLPSLPSRVTGTAEGKLAVIGDAAGRLHWWSRASQP
jgi:mono/diheme cytochrome c family protein